MSTYTAPEEEITEPRQFNNDFLPVVFLDCKDDDKKFIIKLGSVGLFTLKKENFAVHFNASSDNKFAIAFKSGKDVIYTPYFSELEYDKYFIVSKISNAYIKKYYS